MSFFGHGFGHGFGHHGFGHGLGHLGHGFHRGHGYAGGFALIVVLFILLIIVGTAIV